MNKIIVLAIAVLIVSNYFLLEATGKVSIKKSDEKRCINIYEKFLKMGEKNFRERYPHYPIMGKCMQLYKDPSFVLKHTPDLQELGQKNPDTNILSFIKIGPSKFLTKFSICYEEKRTNYILITSDKEQIVANSQRLPVGPCPSFWVVIFANDITNTEFSWDYQHKSFPKSERKVI